MWNLLTARGGNTKKNATNDTTRFQPIEYDDVKHDPLLTDRTRRDSVKEKLDPVVLSQWVNVMEKTNMYLTHAECLRIKNSRIYFLSFDCSTLRKPPYEYCNTVTNWLLSNTALERFDPELVIIGMYNLNIETNNSTPTMDDVLSTKAEWEKFWVERVQAELRPMEYQLMDSSRSLVPESLDKNHRMNTVPGDHPSRHSHVLVFVRDDLARKSWSAMNVGYTYTSGPECSCYAVRFEYQNTAMAICCVKGLLDPFTFVDDFYDDANLDRLHQKGEIGKIKAYQAKMQEVNSLRVYRRNQLTKMLMALQWEEVVQIGSKFFLKKWQWNDHPFKFFCGVRDLSGSAIKEFARFEGMYMGLNSEQLKLKSRRLDKENPLQERLKTIQRMEIQYDKDQQLKILHNKLGVPHKFSKEDDLDAFLHPEDSVRAFAKDIWLGNHKHFPHQMLQPNCRYGYIAVEAAYIDAAILDFDDSVPEQYGRLEQRMRDYLKEGHPPSYYALGPDSMQIDAPIEMNFGSMISHRRGPTYTITLRNDLSEETGIPLGFCLHVCDTNSGTPQMKSVDMVSKYSNNFRRNHVAYHPASATNTSSNTKTGGDASLTYRAGAMGNQVLKEIGKGWKSAPKFMRIGTVQKKQSFKNVDQEDAGSEATIYTSSMSSKLLEVVDESEEEQPPELANEEVEVEEDSHGSNEDSVDHIDLSKYLIVAPGYGSILPGCEQKITVSMLIDRAVPMRPEKPLKPSDIHLIVRCKESCKDQIIVVKVDDYSQGLLGADVTEYRSLGHTESVSPLILEDMGECIDREHYSTGVKHSVVTGAVPCSPSPEIRSMVNQLNNENEAPGKDRWTIDGEERANRLDFIAKENDQIEMAGIISQCQADELLPCPKELWWLLDHISSSLNRENVGLSTGEHEPFRFKRGYIKDLEYERPLPFLLAHFLEYCHLSVVQHSLRLAREVETAKLCIEKGYKIPLSVSTYACLELVKQFCQALPSPLVCQSNLVSWIDCDDTNRHDLCNAFLWTLSPYKRNILVLILSLARELLSSPKARHSYFLDRLHEEFETSNGYSLKTEEGDTKGSTEGTVQRGREEMTDTVLQYEDDFSCWELCSIFHTRVMAEWIGSFVVERVNQTPESSRRAHNLIAHFLVTPFYRIGIDFAVQENLLRSFTL